MCVPTHRQNVRIYGGFMPIYGDYVRPIRTKNHPKIHPIEKAPDRDRGLFLYDKWKPEGNHFLYALAAACVAFPYRPSTLTPNMDWQTLQAL